MIQWMNCLCLKCSKEPGCEASHVLRDYQVRLMAEGWIWKNKRMEMVMEVTAYPEFMAIKNK